MKRDPITRIVLLLLLFAASPVLALDGGIESCAKRGRRLPR